LNQIVFQLELPHGRGGFHEHTMTANSLLLRNDHRGSFGLSRCFVVAIGVTAPAANSLQFLAPCLCFCDDVQRVEERQYCAEGKRCMEPWTRLIHMTLLTPSISNRISILTPPMEFRKYRQLCPPCR